MSLLKQLKDNVSRIESAGQIWSSSLLPSFLSLQTSGLTTDTCLVTVGEQGQCTVPLLAHSLVLAANSPLLASILATSSDSENITLILCGVEREEMEGVLKDIYLGRERARVFLQQWGLWELEKEERVDGSEEREDIGLVGVNYYETVKYLPNNNITSIPSITTDNCESDERKEVDEIHKEEQNPPKNISLVNNLGLNETTKQVKISNEGRLVCPVDGCTIIYNSHPDLRNHIRIDHKEINKKDKISVVNQREKEEWKPRPEYLWATKNQICLTDQPQRTVASTNGELVCPVSGCRKQFDSHPSLRNHIKEDHRDDLDRYHPNRSSSHKLDHAYMFSNNDQIFNVPNVVDSCVNNESYVQQDNYSSITDDWQRDKDNLKPSIDMKRKRLKLRKDGLPGLLNGRTLEVSKEGNFLLCPEDGCETKMLRHSSMRKHLKSFHGLENTLRIQNISTLVKSDITILENGKFQCPKCEKQFLAWVRLRDHFDFCHDGIKGNCEYCGHEGSKRDVAIHIQRKHGSDRYKCVQCDYTSTMKGDLKNHVEVRHSGVKHMCEDCGQEYRSASTLGIHKKSKHSGVLLQCDQCDYKMEGQPNTMKLHKRMVHDVSKFLCMYCPYISQTKDDLEQHKVTIHAEDMLEHILPLKSYEQKRKEKEKNMDYKCTQCGKKLQTRQGLQFHMKSMHHGIRFPCHEVGCGFKAKQKQSLVTHTNSLHKGLRHYCDMCDFSSGTDTVLRKHKTCKHKISVPVFACDKCGMRSKYPEKTRKHMITMHN